MVDESLQSLVTRDAIIVGLVAGLVHVTVSVVLWNSWFDNLWRMFSVKPQNAVYLLLGMFLLGFVPVLFYVGNKVRSPAVIVGTLLFLSGFASVLAGPVTAPSASPTPFALYILLWPGIVALSGLTGVWENHRAHRVTS